MTAENHNKDLQKIVDDLYRELESEALTELVEEQEVALRQSERELKELQLLFVRLHVRSNVFGLASLSEREKDQLDSAALLADIARKKGDVAAARERLKKLRAYQQGLKG